MLRPWEVALGERIDPARETPVYLQIVHALIRDVETGRLPPGTYLPSSRQLAQTLGVNRKTVVLAYEDLVAQGWLTTLGTRGTAVSEGMPAAGRAARALDRPVPGGRPMAADFAEAGGRVGYAFSAPPERPLWLPGGSGPKIDEGAGDGRLFPADVLARAYRAAIFSASRGNRLQYRDPLGSPALREEIAQMLRAQRGLAVGAEGICVTRGSQNGLFLALQVLIRPGDAVIFEALTYEPAMAAVQALGGRVIVVGLDEGGVRVEEVEAAVRAGGVRAIFLTPHHQFPTTVALRPDRRLRLLEIARRRGVAVIEDDYDHEFHFQSQPLLPMAAYAPDQVLYLGSFSKLALPALRLGYLVAPPAVMAALAHRVALTDAMGSTIAEEALAELMRKGELRRHARKAWRTYADRRDRFVARLQDHLSALEEGAPVFTIPDGGLAIWLRLGAGAARIEPRARALGLRFATSASYKGRGDAPDGLRLGFASLSCTEAEAALDLLARAMA